MSYGGNYGGHALILAAEKGKVNELKALLTDSLVKNQINTPIRGTSEWTAYCAASCKPYVEVQRILIEHGADIHELKKLPSVGCFAYCFSGSSNSISSAAAAAAVVISAGL